MADDIRSKLVKVQAKLKAPKNQYNSFGKYKYRNCEDILEAVKPLLEDLDLSLTLTDQIEVKENGRTYVKAQATLYDGEGQIFTTAYAREPESKKGMDESQVTGASSSYARKYALNGLFLIDDQKDADNMDNGAQTASKPAKAKAKPATAKQSVTDGAKKQAIDAIGRYCDLHNTDKKAKWEGIKKRPNYADTAEFWTGIYAEFSKDIEETMKGA